MTRAATQSTDARLLNDFQRDVPVVARPFATIGRTLGIPEATVIDRLHRFHEDGTISRFGATCRPNTAAASTLAAIAAPPEDVERVAAIINAEPGVNHSYLRENDWNLWFVATGPDRAHVTATLRRISKRSGLRVLDLRLVRPFNIDLGFDLTGAGAPRPPTAAAKPMTLTGTDRQILQELSAGLPLERRPFAALAQKVSRPEATVIAQTRAMIDAGAITRFGVIVRHRALGWRANAMVVWQVPPRGIVPVGRALAALPGVTLCYQRRAVPDAWPYTLYSMVHARSRDEAQAVIDRARGLDGLTGVPSATLFSLRCFKQTGALIHASRKEFA